MPETRVIKLVVFSDIVRPPFLAVQPVLLLTDTSVPFRMLTDLPMVLYRAARNGSRYRNVFQLSCQV